MQSLPLQSCYKGIWIWNLWVWPLLKSWDGNCMGRDVTVGAHLALNFLRNKYWRHGQIPLNKHCTIPVNEVSCGHRSPAGTGVRHVASTCMCVCPCVCVCVFVCTCACVYLEEWKGVNEGGIGNHLLDLQLSQLARGSILTAFSKSYILWNRAWTVAKTSL